MLTIDGAMGEGGGQILRSALALSLATGTPFRLERVRAGRRRPGLRRQHLTAVKAAAAVGRARVEGAALGSARVVFAPQVVTPGEHRFSIGTAGSTTLVLQAVLPALLTAAGPSVLRLEGGTHNPMAPPFDFLERTFLPLVGRLGPEVTARLERPGFYPAGGGRFEVRVAPCARLARLDLLERGEVRRCRARAYVANLPRSIGEREVRRLRARLGWEAEACEVVEVDGAAGPGNAVVVEIESAAVTEVFTAFGARGVPAERVADRVAAEVRRYLAAGVPVGPHLADQLLVPLALGGGGSYRTVEPTPHTRTNAEVVESFLDVRVRMEREEAGGYRVALDVTA